MSEFNDFLDRLGAAAKRTADNVATDVKVAAEEQKIREAYQALGKLYYQAKRSGGELDGMDFADQCRKVEASMKRINELRSRKDVTGTPAEDDYVTVE